MNEGSRPPTPAACPECDYSLAGLPPLSREHPCPECGYPATLFCPAAELLRHADRAWLRRVVLGLTLTVFSAHWLLWSLVGILILMVVVIAVETAREYMGLSPGGPGASAWDVIMETAFWVWLAGGLGAHAAGCVLSASPPGPAGPPDRRARCLARWCGAAFAPGCALGSVGLMWTADRLPLWMLYALGAAIFANAIVYLAAEPLWIRHLEWRTEGWRLDRPKKYRSARNALLWVIGLTLLFELPWGSFTDRVALGPDEGPPGPQMWWMLTLIAFVITTESVTKPALRALRTELRQAGTPGARA